MREVRGQGGVNNMERYSHKDHRIETGQLCVRVTKIVLIYASVCIPSYDLRKSPGAGGVGGWGVDSGGLTGEMN